MKKRTPPHANTCPECGWPLVLRRSPSGRLTYYHMPGGPDCSLRPRSNKIGRADGERWPVEFPEYAIALGVIRTTILDALNGYGMDTLSYLFTPLAQSGLHELLGNDDPDAIWETTKKMCRRLLALDDDKRQAVRHALTWGSLSQLEDALANE